MTMNIKKESQVKISPVKSTKLVPLKEAKVLEKIVQGGTMTDAVIEAGYEVKDRKHASAVGKAIWDKHSDENGALVASLEAIGVTYESLALAIKEGLSATKARMVKTGEGDWEEKEEIDHGTRHKFLETAIRVRNADPPKRVDITHQSFEARLFQILGTENADIEDAEVISE
jgi:hypothetical protein